MKKKLLWPILDAMFAMTGLFVSLAFYFFANITPNRLLQTARTLPVLVIATLAGLIISGIYKTILRYASWASPCSSGPTKGRLACGSCSCPGRSTRSSG